MTMSKKILMTLDDDTYKIISSIKGLGGKPATTCRNIILSWLVEKSYIKKYSEEKA